MESDWITNVLLGKVDRPIKIWYKNESAPRNDTLHVFLFKEPSEGVFERTKNEGYVNQGAFHMGDERMRNNISFYPHATYVFRNYYNSSILEKYPNARHVPLGTKSGFGIIELNNILPASQRKYVFNFIGSMTHTNRPKLVEAINSKNISNTYVNVQKFWASPNGINTLFYRNILRESAFTLAPWGGNPESMRLYEALEVGSIPIFQRLEASKSPMTPMGPENPIPQFDDWKEAIEFVDNMKNNMPEVDQLQKKVIQFWRLHKEKIQLKIKEVIDNAFRESHGYDC